MLFRSISLYDEAGQPCVLVDGFRAISVSGVRRSGAPGGTRDVVYHVDWERTPSASQPALRPALPLEQLQAAAATALAENTKWTQFSRCLHQTSRDIPASVKHAAAFIDQTMVIQLME